MAKLVDARDLKSLGAYPPCRFESGPGHKVCMWIDAHIAWRYFWHRSHSGFVSLTIRFAMIGILLGVAVLIAVSSIMNGFDHDVKTKLFKVTNHITLEPFDKHDVTWNQDTDLLNQLPEVTEVKPYVEGYASMVFGDHLQPLVIRGITLHPGQDPVIADWLRRQHDEHQSFHAIMNQRLFTQLNLTHNSEINIYLPFFKKLPLGMGRVPDNKTLMIDAPFDNTFHFMDKYFLFMALEDAAKMFRIKGISGIHLMVDDPMNVESVATKINQSLGHRYEVHPWTERHASLVDSLRLQKNMMLLVFSLIILIASFNLVSGLVMITHQKKAESAVLRTMGATRGQIFRIYMILGVCLAAVGILLGVGLGLILSTYATEINHMIEHLLGIEIVSENVFLIDYLPTKIVWLDVLYVFGFSIVVSLLSVIYPAWSASRVAPAEVLRYE